MRFGRACGSAPLRPVPFDVNHGNAPRAPAGAPQAAPGCVKVAAERPPSPAATKVMTTAMKIRWAAAAVIVSATAVVIAWPQLGAPREAGHWDVEVKAVYPHDPRAFTQGLTFHNGVLYEGTGQYGESTVRRVDLETGRVEQRMPLEPRYFGEGIAILGSTLYQLTWQNGVALVYDVERLERTGSFTYDGEGWGLTHDGRQLIMSDGTETLRFIDPETFEVRRTVRVRDAGRPIVRLNELEYIDGEVWANIWYDDRIVRIDPGTGDVVGWVHADTVYPASERHPEDVLNGIAYDSDTGRLVITGKNWPHLYEIELRPR